MSLFYARRAAACATFAVLAASPPAQACSTCKCGDYSITLLGTEKPYAGRLRAVFDVLARSESQGSGTAERETDEWRNTLGLSYSFTENLTLGVQVPWVRKEIRDANLAEQDAQGWGDADLVGWWVLHRGGDTALNHLAGLRVGLRLPTSEEIERNGQLLDIDVQPDAGALAPSLGGWYRYYRFPWLLSTSAVYYAYGEGHQDFDPGDAASASILGQYALDMNWALQLGLDLRYAQKNRHDGALDDDSGGTLAMLYAGIAARFFEELSVSAGVQLPVLDRLHGDQTEDPALRLSFAYDF